MVTFIMKDSCYKMVKCQCWIMCKHYKKRFNWRAYIHYKDVFMWMISVAFLHPRSKHQVNVAARFSRTSSDNPGKLMRHTGKKSYETLKTEILAHGKVLMERLGRRWPWHCGWPQTASPVPVGPLHSPVLLHPLDSDSLVKVSLEIVLGKWQLLLALVHFSSQFRYSSVISSLQCSRPGLKQGWAVHSIRDRKI